MEKIYNNVSFFSQIINFIIKLTPYKKTSNTVNESKKFIEKIKYKKFKNKRSYNFKLEFQINNKMNIYTFNGSFDNLKDGILLYVHGGSFVENANLFQINFAKKIALKTNTTLIFADYPLAPLSNCKEMFELFMDLYQKIIMYNKNIYFLGDSAGGGFVISLASYIKSKKLPLPKKIIALSPWLDISMSDDKIYEDAKKDVMCGVDGTKYMGKLWANDVKTNDSLISPLYSDDLDIGEITIITGGYDILRSQCLAFHKKLENLKINHNYIFYKNQGHIFGVLPHKEGKLVIQDIVNIIKEDY